MEAQSQASTEDAQIEEGGGEAGQDLPYGLGLYGPVFRRAEDRPEGE
jgi:hypothetical protein